MKRIIVLAVVFLSVVHVIGLPFDLNWRLDNLEENQNRGMMDLKHRLREIIEMITNNSKNTACANSDDGEIEQQLLDHDNDKSRGSSLDRNTNHQVVDIFTVIKRAFVDEKSNIRKTLYEITNDNQKILSTLREEIVSVLSENLEEISRKFTSLPNLKKSTESSAQQISQLHTTVSGSATETKENMMSMRQILATTQLHIERLVNVVNELKLQTRAKPVWFSEPNQNSNWQYQMTQQATSRCFKSSCYFIGQKANWTESKTICEEFGAQLAEVDSEEENNFLIDLATYLTDEVPDFGVYLGASDLIDEGLWKWAASDRKLEDGYSNFNGSEPNGKTRENCLHLYRQSGWKWNDTPCSLEMGFICEVTMA